MICVNSILQFNMHLHLCTPIQSMKLDIRFGAHKPLLSFLLPLAYITIIMMSESIFCFCVNCQMLYWPLYDLYFPVMYGNKLFEIEIEFEIECHCVLSIAIFCKNSHHKMIWWKKSLNFICLSTFYLFIFLFTFSLMLFHPKLLWVHDRGWGGVGWGGVGVGVSICGHGHRAKKWCTVGQKVTYSGPKCDVRGAEKWRTGQNAILECYNM